MNERSKNPYFLPGGELNGLNAQPKIFISESDTVKETSFLSPPQCKYHIVRPEIIFGKMYESIGFSEIKEVLQASL